MSTLEPERGAGTGTLVEPTPQTSSGDGDHERYAHYVQKDRSWPVPSTAHPWSPSAQGVGPRTRPKKYPVCPMCKEIYESMGPGGDKGKGGGGKDKK
ncbi:DUF3039 domain-containing protein [Streptomyces gougerotii]